MTIDANGEALNLVQKVFGLCAAKIGTKAVESMQARNNMLRRIPTLEEERAPANSARGWKIEGQKRRVTRKECRRLGEAIRHWQIASRRSKKVVMPAQSICASCAALQNWCNSR